MAHQPPDRLTVQARFEEEVAADRAELELVVAGRSFFSGNEALSRAEEVAELVSMLREFGIEDNDIALRDVAADTQKGVLTDSSSARYTLRVVCRDLGKVADVMVAATKFKHTELAHVVWAFPEDTEAEERRLAQALERANRKAEVMARTLGVSIIGVWHATFDEHGGGIPQPMVMASPARARRASVAETLDMSVVSNADRRRLGPRRVSGQRPLAFLTSSGIHGARFEMLARACLLTGIPHTSKYGPRSRFTWREKRTIH